MSIESADHLIRTLQNSGLFTATELRAVVGELAPLGDDLPALMRHLVQAGHLTLYQLRKVVHGKAAELFLGRYVIRDKIGEGGMGKVYRASQRPDGPEVALKVVRPSLLSNPVVRGRYEREVQAARSLSHPNVVGLLDAGEADGKYYLAMEFVDGIDLARLVREHGVLPCPEACEYVRQAALGLQNAHEIGLVHRDIKPSNVVVSGERHLPGAGEPAVAKILDMGLVRSVGFDEPPGGPDLTRDGTVVGTPDYMAPEQAKNSSAVDHRADLYSLGCTFYFLLTGKPPFAASSPIEKIFKHQLDPPPPLQLARPDVPAELARVVSRLMAKKPEERYQTAAELADALVPLARHPANLVAAALTAGVQVPAGPPSDSFSNIRPPSTLSGDGGAGPVPASPISPPPATPTPEAAATASTVRPTDRTPRPANRPASKKDRLPPSPPRTPRRTKPRVAEPEPQPPRSAGLLIAAAVAVGVMLVLVFTLVLLVALRA